MYTLLLQNNSTSETMVYSGLTNVSNKRLYMQFDNIDIDLPDGEYTYAVFPCDRSDVEYDFHTPLIDSIVTVEDTEFQLRAIAPAYGLVRIGDIVPDAKYDNTIKETYYYE